MTDDQYYAMLRKKTWVLLAWIPFGIAFAIGLYLLNLVTDAWYWRLFLTLSVLLFVPLSLITMFQIFLGKRSHSSTNKD